MTLRVHRPCGRGDITSYDGSVQQGDLASLLAAGLADGSASAKLGEVQPRAAAGDVSVGHYDAGHCITRLVFVQNAITRPSDQICRVSIRRERGKRQRRHGAHFVRFSAPARRLPNLDHQARVCRVAVHLALAAAADALA